MTEAALQENHDEDSADEIGSFLQECEQFCAEVGWTLGYLSNQALSQTYALGNLATLRDRLQEKKAKVRAKMAEVRKKRAVAVCTEH